MTPRSGKTKVAIVGFCDSSRAAAPYENPEFEIWGLNRGYIFMPRADRWFDMHSADIINAQERRPGQHVGFLTAFRGPVYVHQRFEFLGANQVIYPLQAIAADLGPWVWRIGPRSGPCTAASCATAEHKPSSGGAGNDVVGCGCTCHRDLVERDTSNEPYLSSSIAYEIALAIYEGFSEIHLYGVDLNTESEYAWQKPGVEFLLGVAAGRGIRVVLPENCPLLKGTLYGRGFLSERGEHMSYEQLSNRLKALQHDQAALERDINEITGAHRELVGYVMPQMPPGVDQESVDKRRQQMERLMAELRGKHAGVMGAIRETAYWLHQTMAGQEPREAIAQLASLLPRADDGPESDLDLLQSIDPATQRVAAEQMTSAAAPFTFAQNGQSAEEIPAGVH